MSTPNDILYQKAIDAVQEVFSDKSVPIEKAIENLYGIIGEIQILIDCLESDLKDGEE